MKFRFVIHYNLVREISLKLIKKMPPKKATVAEFGQFSYGKKC